MDKLYPLDVDRAFKVLTRLRGDIKKFWDSGPLPGVLLSRQEVTMSTVWDGRVADLQKQGVPVERQLNGMRRQFQGYAIAKGAANADNAYQLMDFSLRAEIQANLAKAFPSNPSSPLAYDKLTEDAAQRTVRCAEVLRQGFRRGRRLVAEERIGRHQALAGVGSWLNSVSPTPSVEGGRRQAGHRDRQSAVGGGPAQDLRRTSSPSTRRPWRSRRGSSSPSSAPPGRARPRP